MSQVVRKFFIDYEKEEEWLNDMSAKGFALIEYSWARYVFEESGKGEYIYRLELLEDDPDGAKAADYLGFLEETGVERVPISTRSRNKRAWVNKRWLILRKKASEGSFIIYSDTDSKIKHYQRISSLWISLAMMELIIGLINVMLSIMNNAMFLNKINLSFGVLLIALGIFFILLSVPIRRKVAKLQRDKLIRE